MLRGYCRRLVALVTALLVALPASAFAGQAEESLAMAQQGADHFKKNEFYEAALKFERAWQLDPKDPKYLRYAGRAWQEVGHWKRARELLELYFEVETNAEHKLSILEKLEPLRKATPEATAEALAEATKKYPQAKLAGEAALAFEALGDEASLRRAQRFWELARLSASTPAEKAPIDEALQRVQARLLELGRKKEPPPEDKPPHQPQQPPVPPTPPPTSNRGTALALYAGGGALLAGGVLVAVLGTRVASEANDKYKSGGYASYQAYLDAKGGADAMYWAGLGGAVAGAGLIVWGALLPATTEAPRTSGWSLQPLDTASPAPTWGLALSRAF